MRLTPIIAALVIATPAFAQEPEVTPWHAEQIDEDRLLRDVEAVAAPSGAARTWPAWDKRALLPTLGVIEKVAPLGVEERRALEREGFVVTTSTIDTYAHMYHLIYTQDLPVFVTMDSLFFAVGAGYEAMLESLEQDELAPRIGAALALMHGQLPVIARAWDKTLAKDLDVYLAVARTLLSGQKVPLVAGGSAKERDALVDGIIAASGLTTLDIFGRTRAIDFGLYRPRGAYTSSPERERWFRAAYFLQMFELNVVSRDCQSSKAGFDPDPSETPREAALAVALSELVRASGVAAELQKIDAILSAFVGQRADASPAALQSFAAKLDLGALKTGRFDALQKQLAGAIGASFARTAPTHPMPTVPNLPVVTTLLGVHATESTQALARLLTPAIPRRTVLSGADVAYALGHDRALAQMGKELSNPLLRPALDLARSDMRETDSKTLRGSWLEAIEALAEPAQAGMPSFMRTNAFADLRVNSAIASYAHLRHANVLLEAQSYAMGGCDIPDGFVEPAPATMAAFRAYAARGKTLAALLDAKRSGGVAAYYKRMDRIFAVLERIIQRELLGQPLVPAELAFLHQVAEEREDIYSSRLDYDGWYFDLYFQTARTIGGDVDAPQPPGVIDFLKSGALVADIATAIDDGGAHVSHIGTSQPRFGIFVVDTGGAPRALAGPLATAYTIGTPIEGRLNDETAKQQPIWDLKMPWFKTIAPWVARRPPPEPDVRVNVIWDNPPSVRVETTQTLKNARIRVVDDRNIEYFDKRISVEPGEHSFECKHDMPADTEPVFTITLTYGKHRWSAQYLDLGSYRSEGEY